MSAKKPFRILPRDKKLLKSSRIRSWLKEVEEIVKKDMEENGAAWWNEE